MKLLHLRRSDEQLDLGLFCHLAAPWYILTFFLAFSTTLLFGQDSGTLLLEQPDMNDAHIVFVHAADVWIVTSTVGMPGASPAPLR